MKNELEKYLESRFRLNTIRGITNEIKLYQHWCEKENIQIETANYNDILAYINYCKEKEIAKEPFTQSSIASNIITIICR